MSMKCSRSLWKIRARRKRPRPTATATGKIKSTPFGVRALVDLLEIWIGIADPIAGRVDIALVHRLGPRDNLVAHFYWLGPPRLSMTTQFVKPIIHCFPFYPALPPPNHPVLKNPAAKLPRPAPFFIVDI